MTALLPEDVVLFFQQNIDSIAEWEAILLMRANAETDWTADSLAQGLYIRSAEAEALLARLMTMHLLQTDLTRSTYRYLPSDLAIATTVTHAAELYTKYLIPITHLIHNKSKRRVQQFADAFRIRKE